MRNKKKTLSEEKIEKGSVKLLTVPFYTIIEVIIQNCHATEKKNVRWNFCKLSILNDWYTYASSCHSWRPSKVKPTGSLTLTNFPAARPSKLSGWAFLPLYLQKKNKWILMIHFLKDCGNCLHLLSCMTPKCIWAWLVGWWHSGISSTSPKPPVDIDGLENVLLTTFSSKIALAARCIDWGNVVYYFWEMKRTRIIKKKISGNYIECSQLYLQIALRKLPLSREMKNYSQRKKISSNQLFC